MSVDPTKVQLAAPAFDIDKIAAYSSQVDSSPASVPTSVSYSIPGGYPGLGYNLATIPNPYGKKCLTNMSWSVDGADYYDQDDQLQYYNATQQSMLIQMQVFCGCDNNTIYFFFQNTYTSTQTVYIIFAIDSIT
jgi:hypothetical protein